MLSPPNRLLLVGGRVILVLAMSILLIATKGSTDDLKIESVYRKKNYVNSLNGQQVFFSGGGGGGGGREIIAL